MPGHHQDAEYSPNHIYIRNRSVRTPYINVFLNFVYIDVTIFKYLGTERRSVSKKKAHCIVIQTYKYTCK